MRYEKYIRSVGSWSSGLWSPWLLLLWMSSPLIDNAAAETTLESSYGREDWSEPLFLVNIYSFPRSFYSSFSSSFDYSWISNTNSPCVLLCIAFLVLLNALFFNWTVLIWLCFDFVPDKLENTIITLSDFLNSCIINLIVIHYLNHVVAPPTIHMTFLISLHSIHISYNSYKIMKHVTMLASINVSHIGEKLFYKWLYMLESSLLHKSYFGDMISDFIYILHVIIIKF